MPRHHAVTGGVTHAGESLVTLHDTGSDPADLHYVHNQVLMRASFSAVFSCLCRLSQPETFALVSGLGSSMLPTLFVVPCICHYFHVPVAIVKCIKFYGFVTIFRGVGR